MREYGLGNASVVCAKTTECDVFLNIAVEADEFAGLSVDSD